MIEAPFRIYLGARNYDVYTHQGWENSDTQLISPVWPLGEVVRGVLQKSQEVEVSITVLFSLTAGEPVYLGGYPVSMSIDYQLEVPKPSRYRISVAESALDPTTEAESLPLDLQEAVWKVQDWSRDSGEPLTESDIISTLPEDVSVVSWEYGVEGVNELTVERRAPIPPDALSVRTTDSLTAGSSYHTTVHVSKATKSEL